MRSRLSADRSSRWRRALAGIAVAAAAAGPARAAVWYVQADAIGGDGSSWADAAGDLNDVLLNHAQAGDEIWVSRGTYRPGLGATPDERCVSFVIPADVRVYGGFDGTETDRDERDPSLNETVLTGDVGVPGLHTDNAYHVISMEGTSEKPILETTVLDGLTIERGYAWPGSACAEDPSYARGGGLFVRRGRPLVRNCRFRANVAQERGGAIYAEDDGPVVVGCVFEDNHALIGEWPDGGEGGAIAIRAPAPPEQASVTVMNSRFSGNTAGGAAPSAGGAVHLGPLIPRTSIAFQFVNCLFNANTANAGAALQLPALSAGTLVNCTFTGNDGGAAIGLATVDVTGHNLIVWDNPEGGFALPLPTLERCLVQGGWAGPGTDILDVAPQFVDPVAGNFRLAADSPALDFGDNAPLMRYIDVFDLDSDTDDDEPQPDLDGARRIEACVVDLGPYERDQCPPDLTGDDDVGFADLLAVLAGWGPCGACAEDLDGNGDVGFGELLEIVSAWGPCPCAR